MEPGLWISVRWSSCSHPGQGIRDAAVKPSAELYHDCFWVFVTRIIDEVPKLIKVVIDQTFTLEISSCLESVDRSGLCIQSGEDFMELILKVMPVIEA